MAGSRLQREHRRHGRVDTMTARSETYELMRHLSARGLDAITFEDANTLRRAALTLHRWDELECGDSDDYKSWAIERDEITGAPYMVIYPHSENKSHRTRIADREAGALRRVAAICRKYGAYYFHQSDPRGAALYISAEPMTDSDYSGKGVPA